VARSRVSQLAAQDDFPDGVELRMGKVWWWTDIREWAERKVASWASFRPVGRWHPRAALSVRR
jgi:hypothetical protein